MSSSHTHMSSSSTPFKNHISTKFNTIFKSFMFIYLRLRHPTFVSLVVIDVLITSPFACTEDNKVTFDSIFCCFIR